MYVRQFRGDLMYAGCIHPKPLAGCESFARKFEQDAFEDGCRHQDLPARMFQGLKIEDAR
jgi:hypothetical protein